MRVKEHGSPTFAAKALPLSSYTESFGHYLMSSPSELRSAWAATPQGCAMDRKRRVFICRWLSSSLFSTRRSHASYQT